MPAPTLVGTIAFDVGSLRVLGYRPAGGGRTPLAGQFPGNRERNGRGIHRGSGG